MMRLVFVNHSHPSMPHVSGMRAWEFARVLAGRGHQVVLLCEWREGAEPAPPLEAVATRLHDHGWSEPFVLAVKPREIPLIDRLRSPQTPSLLRKSLVAQSYVMKSGVFTDFSDAAQPYLEQLARTFKPQVVWGTFGNTDCWLIAKRLARLSGGDWVADMKDAWDWWVPSGLRSLLARRFRDMAAATANAGFNAEILARWFPAKPVVVYSGVEEEWIRRSQSTPPEGFRVVLVGGLYDQHHFTRFISGFTSWVRGIAPGDRSDIELVYAGSDAARVKSAVTELAREIRVDIRGYVPLAEFAGLCQGAAVNVYLWSATTFHHKVVELLCCRRPIISFPGERDESRMLSTETGGSLNPCATESDLHRVLNAIRQGGLQPPGGPEALQHLTWARQADRLESVLRSVARENAACVP